MTRDELILKESIETEYDMQDMLDYLVDNNKPEYTVTKLLEELAELSEVLLKKMNKTPDHQPSQEAIDEEIGDVFMRIYLYIAMVHPEDEDGDILNERVKVKLNKFLGYIKNGQYNGGI